jgi:heme O synthase-like polyprenyltransferase
MVSDYWAFTKPEVNFLIAMATFTGFYLGHATEPQGFPFWLLIHALLGTLLVTSGTVRLINTSSKVSMLRCAGPHGVRSLPAG